MRIGAETLLNFEIRHVASYSWLKMMRKKNIIIQLELKIHKGAVLFQL
jgi:hypothetical protein